MECMRREDLTETNAPIFQPRSPNVCVLFIYLEFNVLQTLFQELGERDPAGSSADVDDTQLALGPVWFLFDRVPARVGGHPSQVVVNRASSGGGGREAFTIF
jgi:hypothetical protein